MGALLDDKLQVGVCAGERLEAGEEEGAGVVGGGPLVAELEDELPDLGDEGGVAVGGL